MDIQSNVRQSLTNNCVHSTVKSQDRTIGNLDLA